MKPTFRKTLMATLVAQACLVQSFAFADQVTPFTLGEITVTSNRPVANGIAEDQVASVVTREEMRAYNRDAVADALNLLSGVTISHGQKNERRVSIRGFETSKVGLFIDGIPVYIPFDGAVDMNRFTTADLAAIQVAKGFTSVAYGPNTMAGAINLVTRKPTKSLEGGATIGFAEGNERQAQVNVGSNQGMWYVQGGLSYLTSDYFRMSSDFTPNKFEDGGHRNNSYRKDQKASVKLGLTPNATDEYALSYISQHGEKGQATMVLSVEGLVYRRALGQPPLLDGIDLKLSAGEVLCLLGPNGAGKTTLLRCLIGALSHERGTVRIDGKTHHHPRQLARCMAYVPQASGDSGLSLLDTVLMGRTPHLPPLALPGKHDRGIALEALKRVGIAHLAARPFNRVSGGERQLALIARALAQQPRLFVMDEPTASLDLGNQARVLRTIRDLANEGMTILVTTHQPEHALLLDARVVALADGAIVASGRAQYVLNEHTLASLYGTPIDVVAHRGVPATCIPRL